MISGLIGIFLGDTALFGSLKRLGTSRAAVVFALHAPMTVIMGWFLLGKHLEVFTLIGCGIVTTGVIIAILGRKNHEKNHKTLIQHMDGCVMAFCWDSFEHLGSLRGR